MNIKLKKCQFKKRLKETIGGKVGLKSVFLFILLSIQLMSLTVDNNLYTTDESRYSSKVQETPVQKNQLPGSSDVSGNELFAEQIGVSIAGNNSIIQHSYITNDTNIFAEMDFSDPAFVGSSFVMSLSNGIHPDIYPEPVTSNIMQQLDLNYDIPRGFLFYDNESDYKVVQTRKNRAMNILKNIFHIDFVITNEFENESIGYLYNFMATFPTVEIWEQ